MSKSVGRNFVIERDGDRVASARTKTLTINNEPIDITTDDSDGFRELLEESGTRSIDMSIEGLTDDESLLEAAATGTSLIESYTLKFESGSEIVGDFRLNSIEIGAPHDDAKTYTAEIQSTGEFTFTAASS